MITCVKVSGKRLAFQYQFSTLPQFTAILETMGYECYTEDDEIVLKRNGEVQEKVKIQLVESKNSEEKLDKKRMAQLKAILKKYRDMSGNRQELQDVMKAKFGVSLVFLSSKDSPYGYLIVDHNTKAVFKGSDVVKVKERSSSSPRKSVSSKLTPSLTRCWMTTST